MEFAKLMSFTACIKRTISELNEEGNIVALVQALRELLADVDTRKRLGQLGAKRHNGILTST
jgi:hypothetical protein